MSWATKYIGIRYCPGGNTIDEGFDCWGLFKHIQYEHFNIKLNTIDVGVYNYKNIVKAFKTKVMFTNWTSINEPIHGCGVLMNLSKVPCHVGVWVDIPGACGVIHSIDDLGVVFSTEQNLNINFWKISGYYKYNEACSNNS